MTDYYGSCSGCDSWEDCCDEEAHNMIIGLCGSAKIFKNTAEAKEWCASIAPTEVPMDFPWRSAQYLFKGEK